MPEDKKTIVKMAHIYSQEGRWDKAIAEYKKLIDMDPEDFNSYALLGDVYVKKDDIQSAFDAYLVCADAYLRLGQVEKASQAQGKIAVLSTESLNSDSRKKQEAFKKQMEGDKGLNEGSPDKALEAYQAVLTLDPNRFDLYQKLGDLFLQKGDTAAACVKYRELGDIYLKNRLVKKAAPLFQKVVELEPENSEARAALAEIYAKNGSDSEAKKEFLFLADSLFLKGDFEQSFQYAQKAEQLKAIESYNYLGHAELHRGKRTEARAWFEKLLKFKLNHGGALWGMGLIQVAEGKTEDALKTLAKASKTDRFYGEILAATADIEAAQSKMEAGQHYRQASEILAAKGALEKAKIAEAAATAFETKAEPGQDSAKGVEAPIQAPVVAAPAPAAPPAPVAPPAAVAVPVPATPPAAVTAPAPAAPPVAVTPPVLVPQTVEVVPVAAKPALVQSAPEPVEDAEALITLANNFEADVSLDEALALYQRVLALDPGHAVAREGMSRVYRLLAGHSPSVAAPAPKVSVSPPPAVAHAAPSIDELAKLAALKNQAEAAQRHIEAEAEDRRLQQERDRREAEARAKAAEEVRERKAMEAKLQAEIASLKAKEIESKQREAESASAEKKRMEVEIRAQIEDEIRGRAAEETRKKADEETHKRTEAEASVRAAAEKEEARLQAQSSLDAKRAAPPAADDLGRRQAEVLARLQDQREERLAPLRRTIDAIRRKADEQSTAALPKTPAKPVLPQQRKTDETQDEMDGFMTVAVADIYVKQGLKAEAQKIYERILAREPGNAEVRSKLNALSGGKLPALTPVGARTEPIIPQGLKTEPPSVAKKSKVSYL